MSPTDPNAERPDDERPDDERAPAARDEQDGSPSPPLDDELEFLDEAALEGSSSVTGSDTPGDPAEAPSSSAASASGPSSSAAADQDTPGDGGLHAVHRGWEASEESASHDAGADGDDASGADAEATASGQAGGADRGSHVSAQPSLTPSAAPDPGAASLIAPMSLGAVVPLQVCKNQAEGSAMQAVAQSAAIAVQDATDFMRSIEQVTAAAVASFTAMYVASGGTDDQALTSAQTIITTLPPAAAATYTTIGADAAAVMASFGLGPAT